MAEWTRVNVRMPDALHRLIATDAARLGITQADYLRQALVAYAAWHRALDAVEDRGADVEDLRDPVVIARLLGR